MNNIRDIPEEVLHSMYHCILEYAETIGLEVIVPDNMCIYDKYGFVAAALFHYIAEKGGGF